MTIDEARRAADAGATPAIAAALDLARASTLNAAITLRDRESLEQAAAIDACDNDPRPPLSGVPFFAKDNLCLGRTTCASRMLERYTSPFEATCIERLRAAGAIPIAKANLDEFAMGSSTEHSAFGPALNPWDRSRVPGGSSGGSAAAVAAGLVPFALGSDTGGSVRQPAAFCGIVGLKPTYGRISRSGLVAFASSLDQVGILATSALDAGRILSTIAGHDPLDATSSRRADTDFTRDIDVPIRDLVIGIPRDLAAGHPAVERAFDVSAAAFARAGARTIPIDLPHRDHAIAAYYLIACAEASSNLARFDGVRYGARAQAATLPELYTRTRTEGFGAEVKRRILLGTFVLSAGYHDAYYATALRARRLIAADYADAFARGCHLILTPTAPTPAFRLGEKLDDPLALYLEDVHTVGVNLAGLPAIALPAGFADEGGTRLPVSIQLIAPAWDEAMLLRAARTHERGQPPWLPATPIRP